MNPELRGAVEAALEKRLGGPVKLTKAGAIEGGCINNAQVVQAADGRKFFLKSNTSAPPGMFEREAEGLAAILAAGAIRAPQPLGFGSGPPAFIVMEFIEGGGPAPGEPFDEAFGRALAGLHRKTAPRFGFERDNYIGATPQPNGWMDAWVDFFRERRLLHQLRLLERRGFATNELSTRLGKVIDSLDRLIGGHGPAPSLVHGDLWAGNFMAGEQGEPVLIDPAVYYGDREVDLAMTELFGRLDARFYAAYREAYPLAEGYDERRKIYDLYHLMNHLNLFGLSYMGGIMGILRNYA